MTLDSRIGFCLSGVFVQEAMLHKKIVSVSGARYSRNTLSQHVLSSPLGCRREGQEHGAHTSSTTAASRHRGKPTTPQPERSVTLACQRYLHHQPAAPRADKTDHGDQQGSRTAA